MCLLPGQALPLCGPVFITVNFNIYKNIFVIQPGVANKQRCTEQCVAVKPRAVTLQNSHAGCSGLTVHAITIHAHVATSKLLLRKLQLETSKITL